MTTITGATRLNVIVGDPIAQVKAPAGVTASFARRGHDGVLAPVRVAPADLPDFLRVADRLPNLDGIIVTVPHKFACRAHCTTTSERSALLGAVNIMRRLKDGRWHGDMVDGLGFVGAVKGQGLDPAGKRALLVGAGGAGSAIGLALLEAGVARLAVHDGDAGRRDALVGKLAAAGRGEVAAGTADPTGFDLVANATPAGMRESDPLPVEADKLAPTTFVGCVITVPAVSPIVAAARERGCRTSTGTQMYQALQEAMVDFLLAGERMD